MYVMQVCSARVYSMVLGVGKPFGWIYKVWARVKIFCIFAYLQILYFHWFALKSWWVGKMIPCCKNISFTPHKTGEDNDDKRGFQKYAWISNSLLKFKLCPLKVESIKVWSVMCCSAQLEGRGEREFPFPTIPRNTSLPFPFPKIWNDLLIPVPVPKSWEWYFSFPFAKFGGAIFHSCSHHISRRFQYKIINGKFDLKSGIKD